MDALNQFPVLVTYYTTMSYEYGVVLFDQTSGFPDRIRSLDYSQIGMLLASQLVQRILAGLMRRYITFCITT